MHTNKKQVHELFGIALYSYTDKSLEKELIWASIIWPIFPGVLLDTKLNWNLIFLSATNAQFEGVVQKIFLNGIKRVL